MIQSSTSVFEKEDKSNEESQLDNKIDTDKNQELYHMLL